MLSNNEILQQIAQTTEFKKKKNQIHFFKKLQKNVHYREDRICRLSGRDPSETFRIKLIWTRVNTTTALGSRTKQPSQGHG